MTSNVVPRFALLMAVSILLSACKGGSNGEDDGAPSACSVSSQKQEVLEIMEFYYFWNDEPAQQGKYGAVDLDDFEGIGQLLDHLRFEPERFDRGFSFVATLERDDRFFREGEFAGFGFSFRVTGTDALEITRVVEGSPAAAAGLQRGFRVLRIDDQDVEDLLANGGLGEASGPASVGVSRTFVVDFCEATLRLRPVAFEKVNANGTGGYFDGLGVDCAADDDVAFLLGDPDEASLDAALTYVTTGACPIATARILSVDPAPLADAAALSKFPSRRYAGAY